jgi:hypothetical protein
LKLETPVHILGIFLNIRLLLSNIVGTNERGLQEREQPLHPQPAHVRIKTWFSIPTGGGFYVRYGRSSDRQHSGQPNVPTAHRYTA